MDIQSLGFRTDFFFNAFDGEVIDKGEYFLIRSFSNPDFFWGNLLLFKKAPIESSFKEWKTSFRKEFDPQKYHHITLAWDCIEGEIGEVEPFLKEGFELERSIVLTAESVSTPPKLNESIEIHQVESEHDFKSCLEIQIGSANDHLSIETWRSFYSAQMKNYRKMIAAGLGNWFIAKRNGEPAGSLGLFYDGEIGRFQIVSTDPKHQRNGVCSSLVYSVAKYAIEELGLKKLVMVADENYHAAKIYESVGFKPTEKIVGLYWWDKKKHT